GSEVDSGRDADPAQRLPAAEAAARLEPQGRVVAENFCSGSQSRLLNGAIYRTRLPSVPPRGDEAVPEGGALLHGEVRDREAQLPARAARQGAQGEARRLRPAAAREAEGETHLRRARGPVPPLLPAGP